jgi:hypothetical protein
MHTFQIHWAYYTASGIVDVRAHDVAGAKRAAVAAVWTGGAHYAGDLPPGFRILACDAITEVTI